MVVGLQNQRVRLTELDGLRGWASLSVMLFHVYLESFRHLFPSIRNPFLSVFLNGGFAVSLFFVISGVALSAPYFSANEGKKKSYLAGSAIKRYVRLTGPIVFFSLIYFAASRLGLVFSQSAADILHTGSWARLDSNAHPPITNVIFFMLRYVYTGADGNYNILPFLWTMPIEMMGSMLLFLLLAVRSEFARPRRTVWILTALLFAVSPHLGAFFIGSIIADFTLSKEPLPGYLERNRRFLVVLSCVVAYAVSLLTKMLDLPLIVTAGMQVLAAAFLVFSVLRSPTLGSFFGKNPLSLFLGKISFSLYILHYVVIATFLSFLVTRYGSELVFPYAMLIATMSAALSIFLSWALQPVDLYSHRLSHLFSRFVLGSPGKIS